MCFNVGEDLYYWMKKDSPNPLKTKVIQGAEQAKTIFTDSHIKAMEAHCGQKKTTEAITKIFYWPEMSADINQWVCKIKISI